MVESTGISEVSEARSSDEEGVGDSQGTKLIIVCLREGSGKHIFPFSVDKHTLKATPTTLRKEQCEAEGKGKQRAEEGGLTTARPVGHVPRDERFAVTSASFSEPMSNMLFALSKIKDEGAKKSCHEGCEGNSQSNQDGLGTGAIEETIAKATKQHSDSSANAPLRIRSTLLIAQAHLSRSKVLTSSQRVLLGGPRRIADHDSSLSQLPDDRPSLLARMTDAPAVRAQEHKAHNQDLESGPDQVNSCNDPERRDESSTQLSNPQQSLRTKLLNRMKRERALAQEMTSSGIGAQSKGPSGTTEAVSPKSESMLSAPS